jgi:hypothetical protein
MPGCISWLLAALPLFPRALLVAPRVLYAHNPDVVQYDSADCHVLGLMSPRNANRPAAQLLPDRSQALGLDESVR